MSFVDLELSEPLLRALKTLGYSIPTPIQRQAIPVIMSGRDVLGCAQTGTGKTAAFALPILNRLAAHQNGTRSSASEAQPTAPRTRQPDRKLRGLVLVPTRELAVQVDESFATYGRFSGLRSTVIYGGVSQGRQVQSLRAGVDIVVATPGRLLDLMEQNYVRLDHVEVLILDEADQMLDMGFLPSLKRIVATVPTRRQSLLFSATMPSEIRSLAGAWLKSPVEITVAPTGTTADRIRQSVFHIEPRDKPYLLAEILRQDGNSRTLVFTRTKHGADRVVRQLEQRGIRAAAIHGNKSQNVRQRALDDFRSERPPVLVATDIAARGLDIDGVSHVVNFDMPVVPEMYIHRIGRTGRAGAEGRALSFCGRDERHLLRQIERLTRQTIEVASFQLSEIVHENDTKNDEPSHQEQESRRQHARSRQPALQERSEARPAKRPKRFGQRQNTSHRPSEKPKSQTRWSDAQRDDGPVHSGANSNSGRSNTRNVGKPRRFGMQPVRAGASSTNRRSRQRFKSK